MKFLTALKHNYDGIRQSGCSRWFSLRIAFSLTRMGIQTIEVSTPSTRREAFMNKFVG